MTTASKKSDYVFLILLAALVALGLVMLTSATGPVAYQKFNDPYWYVKHQIIFGLIPGLLMFVLAARTDYRRLRSWAPYLFVFSLAILASVFVPGIGAAWGTSRSWIGLGGFSVQPIEIAKLTFLCYLAAWFEKKTANEVGGVLSGLLPFLASFGAVAVLIILQPDLGGLLVFAAMAFMVFFVAGARLRHLVGIGAVGLAAVILLVKSAPYRAARFMTFLNPELDPKGIGYHINQAFLAIGSGGLFGAGLGHSRQKYLYLPEVASDSIFAVLAEELGFIATLLVIAVFAAFIVRGIAIARRAPDAFGRLLAAGIIGWIFFQTLFNIGSMLGLLPLTGLPLPFISYGGTSLMVLLAAAGVMTSISLRGVEPAKRRI